MQISNHRSGFMGILNRKGRNTLAERRADQKVAMQKALVIAVGVRLVALRGMRVRSAVLVETGSN